MERTSCPAPCNECSGTALCRMSWGAQRRQLLRLSRPAERPLAANSQQQETALLLQNLCQRLRVACGCTAMLSVVHVHARHDRLCRGHHSAGHERLARACAVPRSPEIRSVLDRLAASKAPTTRRPSTVPKSSESWVHSVVIGAPSCSDRSLSRRSTFAESAPRCPYSA